MKTAWADGICGYFGFSPRKAKVLCGTTGSLERRQALFEQGYHVKLTLAPPDTAEYAKSSVQGRGALHRFGPLPHLFPLISIRPR